MASKAEITGPVFCFGSDLPADLLVNASCVVRMIRDVAPGFAGNGGETPLSDDGAHGLFLILSGVENTIDLALMKM